MSDANGAVRAVVLTALELEYAAVRNYLTDVRTQVLPAGTHFEIGTVLGTSVRIAIGVAGEGNRAAAVLVERAIVSLCPDVVLFVGIAGALHTDIGLGDVVVATRVCGYQGGRAEPLEFLARPRAWDAPHHLQQHARYLARTRWWDDFLPQHAGLAPCAIHFRPVAAGEVVLNDPSGPEVELIRRHYNDVAAVEMESAGAAEAAHLNQVPLLAIRGISDRADGQKQAADDSGSQPVAAAHAAAFALALLVRINAEARPGDREEASLPDDRITVHIGGDVSGQVVAGRRNMVVLTQPRTDRSVSERDIAALEATFTELHGLIESAAGGDAAASKLAELREAILVATPDLATMEHVLGWFRRKYPALAGEIFALVSHPIVHQLVAAAGADHAREYARRIG